MRGGLALPSSPVGAGLGLSRGLAPTRRVREEDRAGVVEGDEQEEEEKRRRGREAANTQTKREGARGEAGRPAGAAWLLEAQAGELVRAGAATEATEEG